MAQQQDGRILWGDYSLDMYSGELCCRGLRVRLQPLPRRALFLLLEEPGKIVTRDEMHRCLWGSYDYSDFDHSLNIAISKLRTALRDSPTEPRFIETLPQLGYRFLAEVRRVGFPEQGKVRLAVLPFAYRGGDPTEEYFCEGLSDELTIQLGALNPDHLAVVAHTSSMRYKSSDAGMDRIGRELGVEYVLEGSVRAEGNRVRVTVALIQTHNQTQVWAHSYKRQRSDVFKIQRDVARRISRHLKVELLPGQRAHLARKAPPYTKAAEACLKGGYHLNKRTEEGFKAAVAEFESALEENPRYAPAYAGMANAYMLWGSHGLRPPAKVYPRGREAAEKALAIDPTVAAAHSALVFCHTFYDWDFERAERQDRRAVELGAFSAELQFYRGWYLAARGKFDEAIREMSQAHKLDPLFPPLNANFCHVLTVARRCEEAIEQGELAVSLDPHFWLSRVRLGRAYLLKGEHENGLAQHLEAVRLSGGPPTHLALLAYAYGLVGDRQQARQVFKDMLEKSRKRYISPYFVAEACVSLGETDKVFDWLEQGIEARSSWISFLAVEPVFDPLRSDPRFDEILSRVGLARVELSVPEGGS